MTGCPGISKIASLSAPTLPVAPISTGVDVDSRTDQSRPVGRKEDKSIKVNEQALDMLEKARKKGETFSDVIIRLSETKVTALQRRGERQIPTLDGKNLVVKIDQDKCMGAESCVMVAPALFALDTTRLGGFRRGADPLSIKEVEEKTLDSETIIRAAKSCPYGSIYVKDVDTGDELSG